MNLPIFNGRFGASGGSSNPAASVEDGYDVVLIVGQSNATGYTVQSNVAGTLPDSKIDWTSEHIFQWAPAFASTPAAYVSRLTIASDPLYFPSAPTAPEALTISPGSAFARAMLPDQPINRPLVLVPCAVPGTTLVGSLWQVPFGTHALNAVAAASSCINTLIGQGFDAKLKYIVWVQGENDSQLTNTTAQYQTELINTLNYFRTNIPTGSDASIIIGQMNPDWVDDQAATTNSDGVDGVHRLMPNLLAKCWFVHGPRNARADSVHYSLDGLRTFGARMAVKALSSAFVSGGLSILSPTDLEVHGRTVSWVVPESDAPLFAVEYRVAGSGGSFTRIVHSPTEYYLPGDRLYYTFDGTDNLEVRVAGLMNGQTGPWSETVTVNYVAVPQAWADLDFANMTVVGGKVTSVPSVGSDTTPWTAPSGKEPTPITIKGRKLLKTTINNSLLIGPELARGAFTQIVLVRHDDFASSGTYFSMVNAFNQVNLWRITNNSRRVSSAMNGDGNKIQANSDMVASRFYAVGQSYDPNAPAGQKLKLYVNFEFMGQADAYTWDAGSGGLTLNALGTTTAAGTNQQGNNGVYGAAMVWQGQALTKAQIDQEFSLALAAIAQSLD